MINVAIVEDHKLVREAFILLVNSFEETHVILHAGSAAELFIKIKNSSVDIVMLDIQLPQMNGIEICRKLSIEYPELKILIVSQINNSLTIRTAIEAGAHGYYSKNCASRELEVAIKKLSSHGFYFEEALGAVFRKLIVRAESNNTVESSLTTLEVDIITLAAKEYSTSEIASQLDLNIRTVESRRKLIMDKTNTKNFIGAIIFAIKGGYISITDI